MGCVRSRALKSSGLLVVFAAIAGTGCAGRPLSEYGTVRVVDGERVLGRYVSPTAYAHYIQARLATLEGRHAEAAGELRAALNADPDSPELHTLLARTYLELGDPAAAASSIQEALRCDPASADVLVVVADLYEQRGELKAAILALQHAVAGEPGHEEAGLRLAELYVKSGDRASALRVLSEILKVHPEDRVVRSELAELLEEAGHRGGAIAVLERMIAEDPGDIYARVRLGRLEQKAGRTTKAIEVLRAAFDVAEDTLEAGEPLVNALIEKQDLVAARDVADLVEERAPRGDNDGRFRVALLQRAVGQPKRSRAVLRDLLERAPRYHRAWLVLAGMSQDAGDSTAALAEYAKVPVDSELFPSACRGRAALLLRLGRGDDAVAFAKRALGELEAAHGKGTDEIVVLSAELHERRGDVAAAVQVLTKAASDRPDSESLQLALASTLDRHGDWQQAVDVAKKGLARRPHSVAMLNFVGYSLTQRGTELVEAEKLLRRALAIEPHNGQVTDSLGWCFFKLGKIDEALHVLETAERLAPNEPEILRHLGDVFAFRRNRPRALEMYRRALASSPDEHLKGELEALVRDLEAERKAAK